MAKFIDFEAVMGLATIEQLAKVLNLGMKPHGRQLRGVCPVHGGDVRTLCISPGVISKRGSLGVFFCMKASEGGDRLGLVAHCMEFGQQDAAYFVQSQFGDGNSTVTSTVNSNSTVSNPRATKAPEAPAFDPDKFLSKLVWNEEVAKAGFTEDLASSVGAGWHPQRRKVYVAVRHVTGEISGFVEQGGKFPPQWLPATNVVKLRRA